MVCAAPLHARLPRWWSTPLAGSTGPSIDDRAEGQLSGESNVPFHANPKRTASLAWSLLSELHAHINKQLSIMGRIPRSRQALAGVRRQPLRGPGMLIGTDRVQPVGQDAAYAG